MGKFLIKKTQDDMVRQQLNGMKHILKPSTPQMKTNQNKLQNIYKVDLFSQSQSSFNKLKIRQIDLDNEIQNYDPMIPKFLQFDIKKIYLKSGLPRIPKSKQNIEEREQNIFMFQNLVRVFKQLTIELLQDYIKFFNGLNLNLNGISIQTKEGQFAIQDAIEYIKKLDPLKPLYYNKFLTKVSQKHADDCQEKGITSDKGKGGLTSAQRMKKYGILYYGGAENIQSGKYNAAEIVMHWVIDDGVQS